MNVRDVTLALLASRAPEGTLCPSEIARRVAADDNDPTAQWRDKMPAVHAAIDGLLKEGLISLSWKGKPLSARVGPYRIRAR